MNSAILLLSFTIPLISPAQLRIRNASLLKDTNLLYYYAENSIEVSGTSGKMSVAFTNGTRAEIQSENRFTVLPARVSTDTMLVYIGKKLITRKLFKVDTLGNLRLQVGNIARDTASV